MLRIVGGVIAGIVACFVTISLVEYIGHQVYPLPAIDVRDREGLSAIIAALPFGALLFVAAAWFLGALVGGAVAARISGKRWTAWLIAVLVAIASIANVMMFPHPLWMQLAAVAGPLLGGWLAGHAARGGDAAEDVSDPQSDPGPADDGAGPPVGE
jgi:hypothetical protein